MVWVPASRPRADSSARRFTTNSTVSSQTLHGELPGRRDRASNAVSPSARQRATQRDTDDSETSYCLAVSAWVLPSITTDKIAARRFDMTPQSPPPNLAHVLTHTLHTS